MTKENSNNNKSRVRHPEKANNPESFQIKKPIWLKVKAPNSKGFFETKKIVGPKNLPSSVAQDASRLYSENILNFLNNSCVDGKFVDFNWDDELVKGTCLTQLKKLLLNVQIK